MLLSFLDDNIDAKIAFTGNPINLIYVPEQLIGSSTSFEIAPNCQTSNGTLLEFDFTARRIRLLHVILICIPFSLVTI